MYQAVLRDFIKYNEEFGTNLTFNRIGKFTKCPPGTYKVALVACSDNFDYHWLRQDSDGFWSHKPGTTPVRRCDDAGNLIIDPSNCTLKSYDLFLGYYAVSGWNNIYNDSSELILNTLNEITLIEGDEIDNQQIAKLEIGMKIDKVNQLLGFEGVEIGGGNLIKKYVNANNILIIKYKYTNNNFIVDEILYERR